VFCEIVDINVLVFTQYYGKGKITVRFLSSFEKGKMARGDRCVSLFFLSQHFTQISVHVSKYVITTKIIIITNMKYLQFILVYAY